MAPAPGGWQISAGCAIDDLDLQLPLDDWRGGVAEGGLQRFLRPRLSFCGLWRQGDAEARPSKGCSEGYARSLQLALHSLLSLLTVSGGLMGGRVANSAVSGAERVGLMVHQ